MAKNDNLKDFITDIADAIRQKKGSTELINPQDFSNEIINIQSSTGGGSGSSSGGSEASTVEYLDVRNFGLSDSFSMFVIAAKCIIDSDYVIAPIIMLAQQDDPILYCALDFNQKIKFPGGTLMSVKDFLITRGFTQEQLDAIPRITKEEFYNISE